MAAKKDLFILLKDYCLVIEAINVLIKAKPFYDKLQGPLLSVAPLCKDFFSGLEVTVNTEGCRRIGCLKSRGLYLYI